MRYFTGFVVLCTIALFFAEKFLSIRAGRTTSAVKNTQQVKRISAPRRK